MIESEQIVVASCLRSGKALHYVSRILLWEDLTDINSQIIYRAMIWLQQQGQHVDRVSVANVLRDSTVWSQSNKTDALEYLMALDEVTQTFDNIDVHLEIIHSSTLSRKLIDHCFEVQQIANNKALSGDKKIKAFFGCLPNLQGSKHSDRFVDFRHALTSSIDAMNEKKNTSSNLVKSNIESVDNALIMDPGDLVILAGRPSHGKTVLALQIALESANNGPVFFYSFEMLSSQLGSRALSAHGMIDYGKIKNGKVDDNIRNEVSRTFDQIAHKNIRVFEGKGLTDQSIVTHTRIEAIKQKPIAIIVDYLTLMRSESGFSKTEQVGNISGALKRLAQEMQCVVICCAQLNRQVDSRPDKRPLMSDLRDSGQVEQDADIVLFTYLHEMYYPNTPRKGIGELICRKYRGGTLFSVYTEWQGEYQRFIEVQRPIPPEYKKK